MCVLLLNLVCSRLRRLSGRCGGVWGRRPARDCSLTARVRVAEEEEEEEERDENKQKNILQCVSTYAVIIIDTNQAVSIYIHTVVEDYCTACSRLYLPPAYSYVPTIIASHSTTVSPTRTAAAEYGTIKQHNADKLVGIAK